MFTKYLLIIGLHTYIITLHNYLHRRQTRLFRRLKSGSTKGRKRMEKTLKRIAMTVGIFTCLLFAFALTSHAADVITSGNCGAQGNNLTWTLTSDDVLTITGEGAMKDYARPIDVPWSKYTPIKTVVLSESMTNVGNYAFSGLPCLTTVTITDSITAIGDHAFSGDVSLSSVTLGTGLANIGDFAFSGCSTLPKITMGNSVITVGVSAFDGCATLSSVVMGTNLTTIGDYAFRGCSALTGITLGNSVSSVSGKAFMDCPAMAGIYLSSGNKNFRSRSGVLYSYDYKTLIRYPEGKGSTSYTIVSGVTAIADYAFYQVKKPTTILLPSGLLTIGESAFQGCTSVTYASLPNSVLTVGRAAYYGCTAMTSLSISNSVTTIGDEAFRGCSALKSVAVGTGLKTIGSEAFYDCGAMTKFTIPSGVTAIGASAFEGCSALTAVSIPSGVTAVRESTFRNCTGLTSVTLSGGVTSIGASAFEGCSALTSATIPSAVAAIGEKAFCDCAALTSVTIPAKVTVIERETFSGCTGLTSVTIPNKVTEIGRAAFAGCRSLAGTLTLPDTVTAVGDHAFSGCTALYEIAMGSGGASFPWTAVSGCTELTAITVASGNQTYKSEGGILFSKDGKQLFLYPAGKSNERYDVPVRVTAIGDHAFDGCQALDSVTVPDSVTLMGSGVFAGCDGLRSVTVPFLDGTLGRLFGSDEGAGLTATRQYYARAYSRYKDYYVPSGLRSVTVIGGDIARNAFENCSMLTSVTLPDSGSSLGAGAFSGCGALTSITIPDGVTVISWNTFSGCSALTSVTIPGSVTSIGDYAFSGCDALAYVHYDGTQAQWDAISIGEAENDALLGATFQVLPPVVHVSSVTVDKAMLVMEIGDVTVLNATVKPDDAADKTVTWSSSNAGVVSVHDGTITAAAPGMATVTATADGKSAVCRILVLDPTRAVTGSGNCGIDGDNVIYVLYADGELDIIGAGEMMNYSYSIGSSAPWHDARETVRKVTVYQGVTSIGFGAFYGCTNLTDVSIPDSVTWIGKYAFEECTALTSIALPESVVYLGVYAFCDCSGLTSIDIPARLVEIDNGAFDGCTALAAVNYFGTQEQWEQLSIGTLNEPLLAAMVHRYDADASVLTVAPTCTEDGVRTYTCLICGQVKLETVPARGHDLIHHAGKEPTFNSVGWYPYDTCFRCDYTTYAEIPAVPYDPDAPAVTVSPVTLQDNGASQTAKVQLTLTNNTGLSGLLINVAYDPALLLQAKPTQGTALGSMSFTPGGRIGANPYGLLWWKAEPDTTNGLLTELTFTVPAVIGKYPVTVTVEDAYDGSLNSVPIHTVGGFIKMEPAQHDHVPVYHAAVPATCAAPGAIEHWTCEVCPLLFRDAECTEEIDSVTVPATGHTPAAAVEENRVGATCTAAGSYDLVVYCSVCHAELSREAKIIHATGHTPAAAVEENRVGATCTAAGHYDSVVYCSACHAELSRQTTPIPATGHTLTHHAAVPATCTAAGNVEYWSCSVCGKNFGDSAAANEIAQTTVPATGHTPAAAVEENRVGATCTDAGSYDSVVYCSVCRAELSREKKDIPAMGHDLVHHEGKAATYTEAGWEPYDTCTRCDYTTYKVIPMLTVASADLNDDGRVNAKDIVLLMRYIAGGYGVELTTDAADLNRDGIVNTKDAVALMRYIAGGYDVVLNP